MLLLGKIPDLAKCFENPQRSQRCIVRIISEETDLSKTPSRRCIVRRVSQEIDLFKKKQKRMLGVTLTKVHSEKSKSRDRLVQKETKENAWGDRSVR